MGISGASKVGSDITPMCSPTLLSEEALFQVRIYQGDVVMVVLGVATLRNDYHMYIMHDISSELSSALESPRSGTFRRDLSVPAKKFSNILTLAVLVCLNIQYERTFPGNGDPLQRHFPECF